MQETDKGVKNQHNLKQSGRIILCQLFGLTRKRGPKANLSARNWKAHIVVMTSPSILSDHANPDCGQNTSCQA